MDETEAPDPLETVHVLKSDFDLLQATANAAMEDYQALLELTGVTPVTGAAPREVMYAQVLPFIALLMAQTQKVEEASSDIERMISDAKRRGGNEIDLGDGRKAVLAGRRRPELLAGLQPITARDLTRRRRGR